jgi:hypothetical protein
MRRNRRRFALETLEPRWLLSSSQGDIGTIASPVQTVITTVPSDRAGVDSSLSSLVVNFGSDVRDDFIDWTGYDINLYQVTAGEGQVPVFDVSNYPNVSFDASGDQATYQLTQPLAPGEYQIVLQAGDFSATLASSGGGQLWDPTQDQTLADFTVAPPGVDLSRALDLGAIGSKVVTYRTAFDPAGGQNPVDLYKISLTGGPLSRLGVELDSQSIGSGFRGALTLFDSNKNILATRDAGSGLPAAPDDPYLFDGLSPGDYYIGVSLAGNLPSPEGVYASATGTGGPYTLKVVADPVTPTRVVGFTLHWDDALDTSPTGVTLAFSGPLDLTSLLGNGTEYPRAVIALDAKNHSWALTPSGFQSSQGQVNFVFNQPLPAGSYTLQVPALGGLTDVLGQPPVGPGQPAKVLASFTVAPRLLPPSRGDLGVLWPSVAERGLTQSTTLLPGQRVVIRVVNPVTNWYTLQTELGQGKLTIQRLDSSGLSTIDAGTAAPLNQYPMYLKAGVYIFTFGAQGTEPASVRWTLRSAGVDAESLVNNGVGQNAALALRLIDPRTTGLTPGSPPTLATASEYSPAGDLSPFPSPSSSSPSGRPVTIASSGENPAGPSSAPVPASLLVTVNSGLLGKPSVEDEHAGVAGIFAAGSGVALSGQFSGLPQGGHYPSSVFVGPAGDPLASLGELAAEEFDPVSATGSAIAAAVPAAGSSSEADGLALSKTDQIEDLAAMLVRWMIPGSTDPENGQAPAELAPDTILAAAGSEGEQFLGQAEPLPGRKSDRIDRAELGVPTTLLLLSAAAYRVRQLARRWWRRSGGSARPCTRPQPRSTGQGPHAPRRRIAGTARASVTSGD